MPSVLNFTILFYLFKILLFKNMRTHLQKYSLWISNCPIFTAVLKKKKILKQNSIFKPIRKTNESNKAYLHTGGRPSSFIFLAIIFLSAALLLGDAAFLFNIFGFSSPSAHGSVLMFSTKIQFLLNHCLKFTIYINRTKIYEKYCLDKEIKQKIEIIES